MHSLTTLLLLTTSLPLITAHFKLDYPPARGFDEDNLPSFPCGKQDTVSANRTPWPVTGGAIDLDMGHSRSLVQIFLALGNDPGSNFNITLLPTIQEQGVKEFCLSGVKVPAGVGVEGMNATLQVVTNGDPKGGLYNCADITFVAANSPDYKPASCTNATGVEVVPYAGNQMANGSQPTGTTTGSASASAASASATKSGAASAVRGQAGAAVGGVAALAVGFAALL